MIRILLCSLLFLTLLETEGGESRIFSAGNGSVIRVEEVAFRLCHWGRNWKNGTVQTRANPAFPGEGGKIRQGVFRVHNGEFRCTESVDLSRPGEARLNLELSSDGDGIETESLVLSADLPYTLLRRRPILVNGKEFFFGTGPEFSPAQRIWAKPNRLNTIELPLNGGKLLLSGHFSALLQDDRKYRKQSCSLRILLSRKYGRLKQARLFLKMRWEPHAAFPLDLSGAANRSFRDEQAGDRKGSWNDQGPENDLRALPSGEQRLGDLKFRILDHTAANGRTCIALKGKSRPSLPASATIPGNGKSGKYLYLLNALGWEPVKKSPVGTVRMEYADGTVKEFPVVSGIDTGNFWNPRTLPNGIPVWRGSNDCATIGVYASKFSLSGKAIRQITFRSAGNAVWMIAAATLSDEEIVPEIRTPLLFQANPDWHPVRNRKDILPGSIIDFSDLLDKPAGKYGFLRVSGDHFEFEKRPGVPVRFWGINNVGEPNFMEKKLTDRMLDELAAAGYNLIRLHHFDQKLVKRTNGRSTELDPVRLDELDYQLAACRKRGIYTTLDLFSARSLEKGEIPEYPDRAIRASEFKALAFLNENGMRNLETFAAHLLNHINPYTKLAWKEDPSIINIGLINEDTLSQTVARSAFVRSVYEKAFREHLKKRGIALSRENRKGEFRKFLAEVYLRGWKRLSGFLRELGVKVPLTDMNYIYDIPSTLLRRNFDFVDLHSYWAHPQFLGADWRLPASVNPESAIPNYAGGISTVFGSRIFGKPFAVTEWDYVMPNPFAVEGAFLTGAYAALQDYSQLCRFDYAWTPEKVRSEESHLCFFDIANDPLRMLSERAGALFFLRRDVSVSESAYPFYLDPDALERPEYPTYLPRSAGRIGLIGRTGVVFRTDRLPAGTRAVLTPFPEKPSRTVPLLFCRSVGETFAELLRTGALSRKEYKAETEIFTSSNGELQLNRKEKSFRVVTPRSEGFAAPAAIRMEGEFASVLCRDSFGAILVASRDGRNLPESRRILILHLTALKNTGMKFSTPEMNVLERYGTLPLLMRRNRAEISLKLRGKWKLFACAFNGERKFEVPLQFREGKAVFMAENLSAHGAIAVYELQKE